ncbi:cupin domain-containing protein [Dongia soli]|uniref:Cupin domain-containing protein n=1 Tax=Dongia soli TaxID=600628 RepID=A0ABU5EBL0_9PROT|nr:cupin domain-containing protein [Dongia soli]MDY0883541.1 cupin domain-containing protein [Dongia soli]
MQGRIAKRILVGTGFALGAISVAYAANGEEAAGKVVVQPLLSTDVTSSGQPIVLPKDPTVVFSMYEIPAGAKLPEHKHPYPRYGYMLSGELRVTNTVTGKSETYKSGQPIIEAIDQWHHAENIGTEPVKLLVIDQLGKPGSNVVLQH